MKRDYLVGMTNRIDDFHEHAKSLVAYVDDTILQLQTVIETASKEIEYFTSMRTALQMAHTADAVVPTKGKLPKADNLDGSLDDLEKEVKAQIASELDQA